MKVKRVLAMVGVGIVLTFGVGMASAQAATGSLLGLGQTTVAVAPVAGAPAPVAMSPLGTFETAMASCPLCTMTKQLLVDPCYTGMPVPQPITGSVPWLGVANTVTAPKCLPY